MAQGGTVRICGQTLQDNGKMLPEAQLNQLRMQVSMVFQGFNLFPHLSVLDNVGRSQSCAAWADETHRAGRGPADQGRPEPKMNAMPASLSGGQNSAWPSPARWPSSQVMLLFDEPTSALDPELVGEVLRS